MKMSWRWILVLGAVSLSACGDGRTPLVLYSPHGRDLLELLETSYEEANPQIDVRWLDMGSQEVYDRYMKYLTGCANLFREGYTDVAQFTLVKG